jgi:hypothetical protein
MNRKQKIEMLNELMRGSRPLKDLHVKSDVIIVDDIDERAIVAAIKANIQNVISSSEYNRFMNEGLISGFTIDMRNNKTVLINL